MEVNFQIFVY